MKLVKDFVVQFAAILLFSAFLYANSAVTISGHIVSNQQVFTGDTLIVTDTLWIDDGVTLTMNYGSVMRIKTYEQSGIQIPVIVDGVLICRGSSTDSVLVIPDSSGGYWQGIQCNNTGLFSRFDYTLFDLGNGNPEMPPVIVARGTPLVIDQCRFEASAQFALELIHSESGISNSYFNLSKAGGISCHQTSDVYVSDCQFINPQGSMFSMIPLQCDSSSLRIDNSQFINEYDGAYIYPLQATLENSQKITIWHSYFENMQEMYVMPENLGTVIVQNSYFLNARAMLSIESGTAYLTGNVIIQTPVASGSGSYLVNASSATLSVSAPVVYFTNNTYYNRSWMSPALFYTGQNGSQIPEIHCINSIAWGLFSDPISNMGGVISVENSDIENYSGERSGNIDVYPEFTDTTLTGLDLSLKDASPCINGGQGDTTGLYIARIDQYNSDRIHRGFIDMGALENQTAILGLIVEDENWLSGTTIDVRGDLIVDKNARLSIYPGVTVRFWGHYKIEVNGSIIVAGKKYQPVVFTVVDTTGFTRTDTVSGGWAGIRLKNINEGKSTNSSQFEYAEFYYGKAMGMLNDGNGGAICVQMQDTSLIRYCRFENNYAENYGGAVYVYGDYSELNDNNFLNNVSLNGGALAVSGFSGQISGNQFEQNHAENGGAVYICDYSAPDITANIFSSNFDLYMLLLSLSSKIFWTENFRTGVIYSKNNSETGSDYKLNSSTYGLLATSWWFQRKLEWLNRAKFTQARGSTEYSQITWESDMSYKYKDHLITMNYYLSNISQTDSNDITSRLQIMYNYIW